MSVRPDSLRVAVAQPRIAHHDVRVLEQAEALVTVAADEGARLVLFPEAYPGPTHATDRFDGTHERMAAAAREHEIWVAYGALEEGAGGWQVCHHVVDAQGELVLRYARAHPATGDVHPVLNGTGVMPGDGLASFSLDGVTVGLLVCSELWQPEVARVHALRGAELILAPAGGGFTGVAANWELLARARAIENACHVCLTVSRFGDEAGSALVAGPESLLVHGPHDALIVTDCDLARARWLRAQDDSMAEPKAFASLPGLLRARRPELYGELVAPAPADAYDYERAAVAPATVPERTT